MNTRALNRTLTTMMLLMAAGTAAHAHGQAPTPTPADRGTEPVALASGVDFRSSRWLIDRRVANDNGEEIAAVSDFIVDRGSGRIDYAVIKTGTTLGMGGRAVAVPFASLRWDSSGKDRFVLASTPEQLKLLPPYTSEGWVGRTDESSPQAGSTQHASTQDDASAMDPYTGGLNASVKSRVEGEITSVERVRTSSFGEQVQIIVKASDGTNKRIALGPSWFVNSSAAAPMRGNAVVVDTLALARDPDQLFAATHLRSGDREVHLREADGTPAWTLATVKPGGRSDAVPQSRFLALSKLPGMKIDCRGNECGKVHDVLLDRTSGEIAFLSIDPNQNFLGIGDTKRLVPWSVASVTFDGPVRIDASKEMVLASPETPKDVSSLNAGTTASRVYRAFDVPMPRFEPRTPVSAITPDGSNAWAAHGAILSSIDESSVTAVEGEVIDISDVTFEGGVQPARALRVRLAGDKGGQTTVLLGPAWYMENQASVCKTGDAVSLRACQATIAGKTYWIAKSIACKETRVVFLDASNAPAWAQP